MNSIGLGTMTDELPDEKAAYRCINYLATTDIKMAQENTRVTKCEDMKHHVLSMAKLASSEKSDAAKTTEAYASKEYLDWVEDHANAVADREITRLRRITAEKKFEFWRSLNSARSKGQIM